MKLYSLLIEVTKRCNATCDQCGSRCDMNSEEILTKEEILSAFRDIRDNIGTYTMLNITGGEPLLRKDLFEMMGEATAMGFEWGMVTNGSLINDDVIAKMKASGMKTITISLDGLKETHESLRHLKGSFDKIITALKKLKAATFLDHLQVTFTANQRNVFEFEELYKILNTIGLDSIRVSIMDPIGRALDNQNLLLSREQIMYFTDLVNRLNSVKGNTRIIWGCPHFMDGMIAGREFQCFAGIYAASILANGDIFVCPNVPHKKELIQGNILKDSFSDVWKNKFEYFRNRPLPGKCKDCEFVSRCKGDSLHTMDFETDTPKFCYRDFIKDFSNEKYRQWLFDAYADRNFVEISADDSKDEVIIEPDAYDLICAYFGIGKAKPLSMFEQQMALYGFSNKGMTVVRYAVPCNGAIRREDNAIFAPSILHTVDSELAIINRNYFHSSDRNLPGSEQDAKKPMKFVGFIHSHPIQKELQYSTGDETIHSRMIKRYGSYVGILVNPSEGTMGAYSGADFNQARLIIPKK